MPEGQPGLQHRILAAAGASIVSALLVNPLDVVKTRVQAASLVTDRPLPSCLLTSTANRYPVRWARPASLSDCQSKIPPSPVSACLNGAAGAQPSIRGASGSQLHRLPMSSCACALRVADLSPAALGSSERCRSAGSPYRPATTIDMLRDIVRKEGLPALWRGTDTAILASIPMVGVYMPLYDHLLQRLTPGLGGYAPVVAGSAARTLAVVLVGPLELVRTRQQGSAAGARTAWGALKDTLRDTTGGVAAAAGGGGGNGSGGVGMAAGAATAGAARPTAAAVVARTAGVIQAVPRLWTGVVATLARDVPFSAIYWGLVEQLRGGLLAHWQAQELAVAMHPWQEDGRLAPGPSGGAVLAANLIAGSTAGAAAAVVTTPFDVVKTQLQLQLRGPAGAAEVSAASAGAADGEARGLVDVVRRVLRTEGPGGLFRGWGPRAARTAPACAVVVASYEVLKLLL